MPNDKGTVTLIPDDAQSAVTAEISGTVTKTFVDALSAIAALPPIMRRTKRPASVRRLAATVLLVAGWSAIATAAAQDAIQDATANQVQSAEQASASNSGQSGDEAQLTRADRRAAKRAARRAGRQNAAQQDTSDREDSSGPNTGDEQASADTGDAASGGAVGEANESAEAAAADEPPDPFAQLLAERKRRDYPEFETTETGFMITEQIRIPPDARANYQRAIRLLEQGSLQQGIALLEQVVEEAPELTAPRIDLGMAYGMNDELDLAEEALLKASQLSPDHPIVYNELGIIYRRSGRFAEARQSYERALEIYPGFHFARRNLAVLCDLYLSDLDCALANYQAYLDSVIADEEVEIWIADINNRIGQ